MRHSVRLLLASLVLLALLVPVRPARSQPQPGPGKLAAFGLPLVVVTDNGRVHVTDGIDMLGEVKLGIHAVDWGEGFADHERAVVRRTECAEGRRTTEATLEVPGSSGAVMEFRQVVEVVSDQELRLTYRCSFPRPVTIFGYMVRFSFRVEPLIGGQVIAGDEERGRMTVPPKVGEPIRFVGTASRVEVAPGDPRGLTIESDEPMGVIVQDNRAWAGDVMEARFSFWGRDQRSEAPAGEAIERVFTLRYNAPVRFALDPAAPVSTDTQGWFPYAIGAEGPPVSLSFLNRAPAGARGFLRIDRGSMRYADGGAPRFWGACLQRDADWPTTAQSQALARRLAAVGVNLLRVRVTDGPGPGSLAGPPAGAAVRLHPERLALFDALVAALKQAGIHVCLELCLDAPTLTHDASACMEPAVVTRKTAFARALVAHVNPHTGAAYRDDPAVALVALTRSLDLFADPPIREPARGKLETEYRAWAASHGVKVEDGKVDFGALAPGVVRYFIERERSLLKGYDADLKRAGVKAPVGCSAWGNSLPAVRAAAGADFVDALSLYDQPVHPVDGSEDRPTVMWAGGLYTHFALNRVLGKPMAISGWGARWPGMWRAEDALATGAVACLQGWDTAMMGSVPPVSAAQALARGDFMCDPVVIGPLLHTALLFRRGDVNLGVEQVTVRVTEEEVLAKPNRGAWEVPSLLRTPELHRVAIALDPLPTPAGKVVTVDEQAVDSVVGTSVSDTGQLRREVGRVATIDTPRTQALYGLPGWAGTVALGDLSVKCSTTYGAVALSSLTDDPIAVSSKLLLTAVSRAENTGMRTDALRRRVLDAGGPPVLTEPVEADVRVRCLEGTRVVPVLADGTRGPALHAVWAGGWLSFHIGAGSRTVFYEMAR